MNHIRFTDRLSFKQARQGVLAAFVLGTLLGLIQVGLDYRAEDAAIDSEIAAQINVSLGPASRIAYNVDTELARELTTGLLQSPPIIRAEIIDDTGVALASVSRPMLASRYRAVSDALFEPVRNYSHPLYVEHVPDELLGHLVIEVDTFHQGAQFLRRAGLTLVSNFILCLVLSLILVVLFYGMLTKPLVRLITDLLGMTSEHERSRLPCPAGHERDEIGALVEVINQQLHSIDVNLRQKLRAEDRLRQYLEELETIVEARTTELQSANRQLRVSNQELERSRQEALETASSRAAFLAAMSHEIRTPINGLLGMIGLALDSPLNDEQRQQLSIAYDSGKILVELLNDILDLSKFEAGKLQLEEIPFDLGALLEDTTSLLSQNAYKRDIELSCRIDPALPGMMLGDPMRIRQIISNLLSNALKFTEQGQVSVYLAVHPNRGGQQWVDISVRDTGIGIQTEALESVFSPFTQADAQISRRFGGTGLGLALCKSLADAMQGTLKVESEQGQGSTFTVSLPLKTHSTGPTFPLPAPRSVLIWNRLGRLQGSFLLEQLEHWGMRCALINYSDQIQPPLNNPPFDLWLLDSPEVAHQLAGQRMEIPRLLVCPYTGWLSTTDARAAGVRQHVASPPSRAHLARAIDDLFAQPLTNTGGAVLTQTQTGYTVLLVEDNLVNQMVAKGMLGRLGYDVAVAEHGEAALQRLHEREFDLVLMDCNMPVMDGYETTRRIREQAHWATLPVIALTANALEEDRERCTEAGMDDYLVKPFKREDLQAMMNKWLGNDTGRAGPDTPASD
ncbi:ATP-binding protein [Pseudomonas sp. gcc21]|uniref:hybrid sensor histidine kinase/response regulator n=1 Tax=Pseudomonas sp. gcc21 TaxID=2726989 RepID=UPI001C499B7A|nr:ATP-binding protein [Pseudomonas sp. gcc21]